jgi:hypothetical protein
MSDHALVKATSSALMVVETGSPEMLAAMISRLDIALVVTEIHGVM